MASKINQRERPL